MKRLTALILLPMALSAVSVLTINYDNSRVNTNTSESVLTQSNVTIGQFGKLCTMPADGKVYGPPLIFDGTTPVAVFATMHNSFYAYNANTCALVWGPVNVGASATNYVGKADGFLYFDEVGCLAGLVGQGDSSTGVVYGTCRTSAGDTKLYALNVADGSTLHAAVTVSATYNGLSFDPIVELQRTALTLVGNNIYLAFTGFADVSPYQGWVISYNKTTLAQVSVWCDVDTAAGRAGIWMQGGGLAVDADGNICFMTGNGTYDGVANFGESFVCLTPSLTLASVNNNTLTPANYAFLNGSDLDLGSGRILTFGAFILGCGKDGNCWLSNKGAMGGLQNGGGPPIAQVFGHPNVVHGFVFTGSELYLSFGSIIALYPFDGSTFSESAAAQVSSTFVYPNPQLTYSSNGSTAGTQILWAVTNDVIAHSTLQVGTLRAYNATTLAEIWQAGYGYVAKFAPPVVANGKVYVATFDPSVVVYGPGIFGPSQQRGTGARRGAAVTR